MGWALTRGATSAARAARPPRGGMAGVVDARTKQLRLAEQRKTEATLEATIARLEVAMREEEEGAPGCASRFLCGLMGGRRGRAKRTGASDQSALDQAVFGQQRSGGAATSSAAERLTRASESMGSHVESIRARAEAAKAQAKSLLAAGRKKEALKEMARFKQAEKQLENAQATQLALERQLDVLAEADVQREVASALSASVATAKKKTKGLLSKTESAVDGSVELRDLAEDVASTLGGIQTDVFDEDELLEELAALAAEEEVTLDQAEQAPVAVGAAVVDAAAFPAPPRGIKTKALERKSLLANDSAAEGMAMGDA